MRFFNDFVQFLGFFAFYCKKKTIIASDWFEKNKNRLVKFLLMHRGRYNRPFLHLTTMGVLGLGVLVAPFLADTYPIFSSQASVLGVSSEDEAGQSILVGEDVFETEISKKPRDSIITYAVQKGDTLSTIAEKFEISVDTIRWANNLITDSLSIGEGIKILPVTGIAHKVAKGESVYTIAKKYDTEAQKIVDFTFNEFANAETFALIEGQMLIVPDGVKPSERPVIKRQVYIASGPTTIYASGFTWPVHGGLSQYFSWYHAGIDITADIGTPVAAAQSGKVVKVSIGTWDGGYGTNVMVDGGAGYTTLYAHLSGVNVAIGDEITAGATVLGWIGMTGRTTGPHVHFEIRNNGVPVNPMGYLQ